ncbi:hypothetical protein OAN307_c01930 [Octadecabacter antarcticus 307]|uniref:Uncharacterized protein n=1 Tax=Octadecabacter antarcticus 307 TaxID=391626 RepID=M9R894_9RHOB|nr:hypothetical protein OAN307_c01930 [Octadecabacter antarcticus 307]
MILHGMDELDLTKIGGFLHVKYGGTSGVKRVIEEILTIKKAFTYIQVHLYHQ